MATLTNIETEAKTWLSKIFQNLQNLSVIITGKTEKGDGYLGDIFFAEVSGISETGSENYHIVLKCSKRNPLVRQHEKFKNTFMTEIFFYNELLPKFINFQESNKIQNIFKSVPKCYGIITEENLEVIVLENLNKNGYQLWSRKEPLTRKHIDLVIQEYGKLHATSTAMKIQQLENFKKITDFLKTKFTELVKGKMFKSYVKELVELFKNDFDSKILQPWENLVEEVDSVFAEANQAKGFKVILHGDCWNNNFMYKYNNQSSPTQVILLDWQLLRYSSPIYDLSYFLFSCISKSDIGNLDEILQQYYDNFSNHLGKFGIDANSVYPKNQFLGEWKTNLKFGLIFAIFLLKMCVIDKEDLMDVADIIENGKTGSNFLNEVKDKYSETYKNRVKHIVDYVTKNNLI